MKRNSCVGSSKPISSNSSFSCCHRCRWRRWTRLVWPKGQIFPLRNTICCPRSRPCRLDPRQRGSAARCAPPAIAPTAPQAPRSELFTRSSICWVEASKWRQTRHVRGTWSTSRQHMSSWTLPPRCWERGTAATFWIVTT